MKRRRESKSQKKSALSNQQLPLPLPNLPREIWQYIVSFLPETDVETYRALLSTHREAFYYMEEAMQKLLASILLQFPSINFFSGEADRERQPFIYVIYHWVWRVTHTDGTVILATSDSIYDAMNKLHSSVFYYFTHCLLNQSYQQTHHWLNVLSFLSLCFQHEHYLTYRDETNRRRDNVSVIRRVADRTPLGKIMYIDGKEKGSPLLDTLRVKVIASPYSHNFDERYYAQAQKKIIEKYGQKSMVSHLLKETLGRKRDRESKATVYELLRKELPRRNAEPEDVLENAVVQSQETKHYHHLFSKECEELMKDCFDYLKDAKDAPRAYFLWYNMKSHKGKILTRFEFYKYQEIKLLVPVNKHTEPVLTQYATQYLNATSEALVWLRQAINLEKFKPHKIESSPRSNEKSQ